MTEPWPRAVVLEIHCAIVVTVDLVPEACNAVPRVFTTTNKKATGGSWPYY